VSGTKGFAIARSEFTGERSDDARQRRVQNIEQVLNDVPFLRGKLHKGVVLVAGTAKTLQHAFGRRASAMVIGGNLDGSGTVFRFTESGTAYQTDPLNLISVVADANCTLDIWLWPRGT
jgi:hypothetical protein